MDNRPFVSIIVLNWNGEAYISKCLDSLLEQTYPSYEVLVVDNGSTDGSIELLRGYLPRIRLIMNEKNLGFAAGNNVAIREANGEFIVLFNNDAVAHRDWLEWLVAGTLTPPQADIASGPIYFYEPSDVIWCAGVRIDMLTGVGWLLSLYSQHFEPSDDIDYLIGCALLVRNRVFEEIGLLDERFFFYSEDFDFCLRAKRAGFSLRLVPDAMVWHMVPMEPEQAWVRLHHHLFFKSGFKLVLKLWPLWCLPLTLMLQLTIIPIAYVLLLRYPLGYPIIAWRAFFAALAEGRRNGFQRDYSRDLPLHIRTGEVLRLLAGRIRRRA
ncbi:MAG: glycosyltransferase family 2 protein [Desulfobacteraceae bacterium]|nr:glycosyltransferase family 2 protein [Desulfobacteraceae bacterium]